MLQIYRIESARVQAVDEGTIGPDSLADYWLDLHDPTPADRARIEQARGVNLPAIGDVREIEATSRFFADDDGLHLRIWFLGQVDGVLTRKPAAFVLSEHCLISMCWGHVDSFEALRAGRKLGGRHTSPSAVLFKLLELHLDQVADLLESVYEAIDGHWSCPDDATQVSLENQLKEICRMEGDRHKVRLALMDLQQVLAGLEREEAVTKDDAYRFDAIQRDLESLLEHSDFISEKLDFLMNMLVSRLNLIDNRVGKILSVVALVFLPPTLIAAVYGMNFHHMPELDWPWSYPLALLAMLASAVIPYVIFKWKRWL